MHIQDEQLEARITERLEASPEVQIPADFTARLMARVPQRRFAASVRIPMRTHHASAGQRTAIASIAILTLLLITAIFAAPQTTFVAYGLEPLLALQLGALLYWQFTRRNSLQ